MNRLIALLFAFLLIFTPTVTAQTTNSVPAQARDTLNQLMVDVLSGVKAEGAEVYQVSKAKLSEAYSFVEREVPEVVKEFLRWRLWRALLWLVTWISVAGIPIWLAYKCRKACEDESAQLTSSDRDFLKGIRIGLLLVGWLIITIAGTSQLLEVAKIVAAPRVYVLEYVVDALKPPFPGVRR